MRRTLASLLVAFCAVAGIASGQQAGTSSRPAQKATLAACQTGASADQRFAVFTGSMPAYRGTKRMAMRFDLFVRMHADDVWQHVRSKGFGRWERSLPGKERFVWTKRVERLLPGADYRVAVRFRWYQSGRPRRDHVRHSPICSQPDQRPDLEVGGIDIHPGPDAGSRTYVVTVLNTGETAAGAFSLTVFHGASRIGDHEVAGLPAGEQATVQVVGPACAAGESVVARVDPGRVVDESDEANNRFQRQC